MGQIKNIKLHIVTDIKSTTTMSLIRHLRTSLSSVCTKHTSLHRCAVSRALSTTSQHSSSTEEDEALVENPYYSKYEDKIKKLKESGVYEPPKDHYNKALMREAREWKEKIQAMEKANGKTPRREQNSGIKIT